LIAFIIILIPKTRQKEDKQKEKEEEIRKNEEKGEEKEKPVRKAELFVESLSPIGVTVEVLRFQDTPRGRFLCGRLFDPRHEGLWKERRRGRRGGHIKRGERRWREKTGGNKGRMRRRKPLKEEGVRRRRRREGGGGGGRRR